MIDFQNCEYIKLKKINPNLVMDDIEPLLIERERVIGVYRAIRDYCVFTDKRIIAVNIQGIGKKKDFTSLPYAKITAFAVETVGVLDLDSELELFYPGMGEIKFEFSGLSDIAEIGRIIASYALAL